MATRFCRYSFDSEDAVNQAFINALRNADAFTGSAPLRTWLTAIVRNACWDIIRKDTRRPHGHSVSIEGFEFSAECNLEADLHEKRMITRMHSAIKGLPRIQRTALERYLADEDFSQQANSTLKGQKCRAVKLLRSALAAEFTARKFYRS